MKNPIEAAVAPLKISAVNAAEVYANNVVARVRKDLEAAGFDMDKCAPYPSSLRMSRFEYMQAQSKYQLFAAVTKGRQASRSMNEPNLRDMCPQRIAHFIDVAKRDAAAEFDAYVRKLVKKIGPTTEATLEGRAVWQYSHLHVTLTNGAKETWKTQQIINVSVLGKLFNQWPTRQVAGAKRAVEKKVPVLHYADANRSGRNYCATGFTRNPFGASTVEIAAVTCTRCRARLHNFGKL